MPITVQGGTGFDRGGITAVNRYFNQVVTSGSFPSIQTGGRRSGSCLRLNSAAQIAVVFPSDDEIVLAFALKLSASPTGLVRLGRLTRAGTAQVSFSLASDGRLTFGRGTAVTGLGTSTGAFSVGFWSQVQIYVKIHDTAGELKVYWNGSATADASLNLTGLDTQATLEALIDGWDLLGAAGGTALYDFDDLIWGTGGSTLFGDVALVADVPTADGSLEDLTCTTGNNMTAMVNESTPDVDDSSTISGSVGKATFTYPALTYTPSSVAAVIQKVMAKKNDSGSRTINDVVKNGGTQYETTPISLTTDYRVVDLIRQDIGGAALTKTNIDANEWGLEFA